MSTKNYICKLMGIPMLIAGTLLVNSSAIAAKAPVLEQGIQFGDLQGNRVMVWSRANKASRMWIEYAYNKNFNNSKVVRGPYALATTDFTAKQELKGLRLGKDVYVKVWFEDLTNERNKSEPVEGHFRTISDNDNIRFVWGGDTAGQGYGINTAFGGMKIYEAMRQVQPQFFIHSGDNIYADGIIPETVAAPETGAIWTNIVTPEVAKVAETQAEFRGRYKYNLMDENVRAFNAEVPQIWQWDDHEVVNNWSDSKDLSTDDRYKVKDVPLLVARAATAFQEFSAQRPYNAGEPGRVYRKISYGPLLDVFVIDMRSYRGPNTNNLQTVQGPETAILGEQQIKWLQNGLKNSKAVWKVIAADMPIGLNVGDGTVPGTSEPRWEAVANGNDGQPLGRELEIAGLLGDMKANNVKNVVWLTADVHYAAAHHYDSSKATFKDFNSFWEFVSGPLNAGSFGPGTKDGTFGIQAEFEKAPGTEGLPANTSPFAGLQFFGEVNINKTNKAMTVDLKDINGDSVYSKTLTAE